MKAASVRRTVFAVVLPEQAERSLDAGCRRVRLGTPALYHKRVCKSSRQIEWNTGFAGVSQESAKSVRTGCFALRGSGSPLFR